MNYVLQAVEIVGEAEQQSLAALGEQGSAGGAAREFSFGGGEEAFHQGASARAGQRHAMHHLVERSGDGRFVEAAQEAVQRRVVRNGSKAESAAELAMFRQPHLGFAIGPVLVAHEAQDGQQLRLRELGFAKCRAITGHGGHGNVQGHLRESHQTHFGHSQQRISPELPQAYRGFVAA